MNDRRSGSLLNGMPTPGARTASPANSDPSDRTARAAILDAAEQIFGTHGFDGGSMREIARVADIAQSLLHYHYASKWALYEAVFARRAEVIRRERQARLNVLFAENPQTSIEQILEVLFMPLERLIDEDRSKLRFYVQMLSTLTASASERSIDIMKRFYDPSAELFVAAFGKALPGLTHDQAVWAYLFAIGARMQAHASSDRASRLGAAIGTRKPYELLTAFVAAGIRAM